MSFPRERFGLTPARRRQQAGAPSPMGRCGRLGSTDAEATRWASSCSPRHQGHGRRRERADDGCSYRSIEARLITEASVAPGDRCGRGKDGRNTLASVFRRQVTRLRCTNQPTRPHNPTAPIPSSTNSITCATFLVSQYCLGVGLKANPWLRLKRRQHKRSAALLAKPLDERLAGAARRASGLADEASQKVGVRPFRPWPKR